MSKTKHAGQEPPSPSVDQTRMALIHAALQLFGSKGFDATSTREIAGMAKANIGSIAYHFGGKEGLRLAAADYIVETIQGIAGQALGHHGVISAPAETKETARQQLGLALERMTYFIVAQPQSGEIVQFLLRELAHPTAALDRIYSGVFEPTHKRLCAIWEVATGEPAESEATRLRLHPAWAGCLFPHWPGGGETAHGLVHDGCGRGGGCCGNRTPESHGYSCSEGRRQNGEVLA